MMKGREPRGPSAVPGELGGVAVVPGFEGTAARSSDSRNPLDLQLAVQGGTLIALCPS